MTKDSIEIETVTPADPEALREEYRRDLRRQVSELQSDPDLPEIIFREISPKREKVRLYRMENGEPISIPSYMVGPALAKSLPDGSPMFTPHKHLAPEYKLGEIKCFMHAEAPERETLNSIGMSTSVCPAAHLATEYAKRIHAEHRHRMEWAVYQDYLTKKDTRETNERQERQLQATLEIAKAASGGRVKGDAGRGDGINNG